MADGTGGVRQRFPPSPVSPPQPPPRTSSLETKRQSTARPPPSASRIETNLPHQVQRPQPFQIQPIFVFYILLASHVLSALYHPILDCDEVFNYWEPTHYLTHGHAFQTWEYSPAYAIRSWAYAGLHALVTLVGQLVPFSSGAGKATEFYTARVMLGVVCAACETRLFSKIAAVLNQRVAIIFLFIMATSPGMFHASISYLPSSFSMYTTMLGMAAFMDWRGGLRTAQGILCIGAGALLGWPFAVAMAIPFLLEEALFASISDAQGMIALFWRVVDGTVRSLLVLALQVAVDVFFYKKLVVVPFNIVWYNVLSGKGGPDLYGTEPWHFYLRNLFLNFHVWLPLALLSMPLMLAQFFSNNKGTTKSSSLRGVVFLAPLYIWLAIFTLQPHKEERFMYPAYPALALNASVSLNIILANLGSTNPKDIISKVPIQLRFLAITGFVISALGLSIFRTLGTITAYNTPLSLYQPLHRPGVANVGDTVCLGKEWYRFPSHFLLPDGVHGKFIRSEFHGLLPGEFSEAPARQGFGLFPGTWLVPAGMNDENREDVGKYTDVKRCTFLVDSHLPSTQTTALEPNFLHDTEHWERIKCLPFLDSTATGIIGRLGWIPDSRFVPEKYRRVWGEQCLLKRRKTQTSQRKLNPIHNIENWG